jgi:hypothetical protein
MGEHEPGAQIGGTLATRESGAAAGRFAAVRVLPGVFFAVVVACLVLPLLQTLYPVLGAIVSPVDEHRRANPFPSPRLLLRSNSDFVDGLNKWFDDRAGFRDLFIRTKNQIDYSVFSTSRKVYVGSDGWLFERDPGLVLERLGHDGLETLKKDFLDLARRLEEKNIRLVVVGYPDKSRIYPEMVPPDEPLLLPGGNHDKLRQFLSRQSALSFIDVEEILRRERATTTDNLYFKTDLHATMTGQIPVVKAIVARIAEIEGRRDVAWDERFGHGSALWAGGNEARFLSLLVPVVENVLSFTGTYAPGGKDPTGRWTVPDNREFDRAEEGIAPLFAWEYRSNPEYCDKRLPGAVLWGISFADLYATAGLQRSFCSLRRLHIQNTRLAFDRLALFLESVPADTRYFIYQYYSPLIQAAPFVGFAGARTH